MSSAVNRAALLEVCQLLGCRRDPAVEGRVGGAQEWVPCDSIRTCHQDGFLSSSMSDDSPKPLGKDPAAVYFARGFVSMPGPQH